MENVTQFTTVLNNNDILTDKAWGGGFGLVNIATHRGNMAADKKMKGRNGEETVNLHEIVPPPAT